MIAGLLLFLIGAGLGFLLVQFFTGLIAILRVSDDIDAEECNSSARRSPARSIEHGPTKKEIS